MKLLPATCAHSFVLLYDTPEGNEEYYAYFHSEKKAMEAWHRTFELKEGYKLVAVAVVTAYPDDLEEEEETDEDEPAF